MLHANDNAAPVFQPVTAQTLACALSAEDADFYCDLPQKTRTAYEIIGNGRRLGLVAEVEYRSAVGARRSVRDWYAVNAQGHVWSGCGRTRKEAAGWVLSQAA